MSEKKLIGISRGVCQYHEEITRCQGKIWGAQKIILALLGTILAAVLALGVAGCGGSMPVDPECALEAAQECYAAMEKCQEEEKSDE